MIKRLLKVSWTGLLPIEFTYIIIIAGGLIFNSCSIINYGRISTEKELSTVISKKLKSYNGKIYTCENVEIKLKGKYDKILKSKFSICSGEYIFGTISFIGIEMGRIEIRPDSVKLINRIEKKFLYAKTEEFKRIYNLGLNYNQLESFILKGMPLYGDETKKELLAKINTEENSFVYNSIDENKRKISIGFDKMTCDETFIKIEDATNELFFEAAISRYNDKGNYPAEINCILTVGENEYECILTMGTISNDLIVNRKFEINSKYSEYTF